MNILFSANRNYSLSNYVCNNISNVSEILLNMDMLHIFTYTYYSHLCNDT